MTEYGFSFFERLEKESPNAFYENTGYLFHKENEAAGGVKENVDYTAEIDPEDARRVIKLLEARTWNDELMRQYINRLPDRYRVWYSSAARSFITLFDPEEFPRPEGIKEDWKDTEAILTLIVVLFENSCIKKCPNDKLQEGMCMMRVALKEIRQKTGREEE